MKLTPTAPASSFSTILIPINYSYIIVKPLVRHLSYLGGPVLYTVFWGEVWQWLRQSWRPRIPSVPWSWRDFCGKSGNGNTTNGEIIWRYKSTLGFFVGDILICYPLGVFFVKLGHLKQIPVTENTAFVFVGNLTDLQFHLEPISAKTFPPIM